MHGAPALQPNFTHFPYVDLQASKGGQLNLGQMGTFDSLNPFIVKGVAPEGLRGLVYESLLARSADEPFSLYPLIAQSIEVPPDRSTITFHLDPKATFSDGKPITADDVIFSHDLLRRKGRPYLRSHYSKVSLVERLDNRAVKFHFRQRGDREIPLIIGLMPILPKHALDAETFDQTSLNPPIGSGPYTVGKLEPGRSLRFQRNPDYWGADIPTRRSQHNFDEIRLLFYRDQTAIFEAFKTGAVDVREEKNPARWIDGYDFPAVKDGRIRRDTFQSGAPAGMTGLVFNTRQPKFSDLRVRQALALAFDGPSINQSLFHGRFVRTDSYFAGSHLASTGRPADAREQALLRPYKSQILPEVMNGTWQISSNGAHTNQRKNLRKAFGLLQSAGYTLNNRRLINQASGAPLDIEFLVTTGAQERIALTYAATLKRLGIKPTVRKIEPSQYWARIGDFEFDMIQWHYSASLSPGNEQINRWSTTAADIKRSLNYAGVKNPAVDAMITKLLEATERDEFISAVRALDRALLSGTYLIPLFHVPEKWYGVWHQLRHPKRTPLLGTDFSLWWHADASPGKPTR